MAVWRIDWRKGMKEAECPERRLWQKPGWEMLLACISCCWEKKNDWILDKFGRWSLAQHLLIYSLSNTVRWALIILTLQASEPGLFYLFIYCFIFLLLFLVQRYIIWQIWRGVWVLETEEKLSKWWSAQNVNVENNQWSCSIFKYLND